MATLGIRIFTDEMINVVVATELRRQGYDAVSCKETGRANRAIEDEVQLQFATHQQRAVLTFNFNDFLRLDAAWRLAGREHAGIILSPEIKNIGVLIRAVRQHLDSVDPATQHNLVLWLQTPETLQP